MGVRRRGFALIIVLLVVGAVFALAIQGGVAMRSATIETAALRDMAALERDARSAAYIALTGLTTSAEAEPDQFSLGDEGAAGESPAPSPSEDADGVPDLPPILRDLLEGMLEEEHEEQKADEPAPARRSGSTLTRSSSGGAFRTLSRRGIPVEPVAVDVAGRRFEVSAVDAQGLLNLNTAEPAQVAAYLALIGVPESRNEAIAQELADWRDDDDFVRPRGAEAIEHQRRGVTPRNGDLRAPEELLFLPSMTRAIYERIRTDVTVVGDGRIHAGSAPREVLLSIPSMTAEAADRILQARRAGPLTEQLIRDALGLAARDALPFLRIEPTGYLFLGIESEGVRFEGEAGVSNREGVQSVLVRVVGKGDGSGAAEVRQ